MTGSNKPAVVYARGRVTQPRRNTAAKALRSALYAPRVVPNGKHKGTRAMASREALRASLDVPTPLRVGVASAYLSGMTLGLIVGFPGALVCVGLSLL